MNGTAPAARLRQELHLVSWDLFGERAVDSSEVRVPRTLADDSLVQYLAPAPRTPAPPSAFAREVHAWRRFFQRAPLEYLTVQVLYQVATTPGLSPVALPPEWTISCAWLCPHMGRQELARVYRATRPPLAELREELQLRTRLPADVATTPPEGPLWIPGDVLARALTPAARHVMRLLEPRGRWLRRRGAHDPRPLDEERAALPLPSEDVFVPHERVEIARDGWRVLDVDTREGTLLLWDGRGYRASFRLITPAEPLYRYAGTLEFGTTRAGGFAPGSRLVLPDVRVEALRLCKD